MTAERTLIDIVARGIANRDCQKDLWATLSEEARTFYQDRARAALRALHDHGPTPAMMEAASKLESDCARLNYGGTPSAEDLYSAMLAAELEGGANG